MNREDQFVITISRQFGTGGHEIGAELARRLDVKLLDKQIINEVAKRNHVVEEAMEKIEVRNPLWRDDLWKRLWRRLRCVILCGATISPTSTATT